MATFQNKQDLDQPALSRAAAYELCGQIRAENRRRPSRIVSALWCWGCLTFSNGPEGRCGAVVECPQVLATYRATSGAKGARR